MHKMESTKESSNQTQISGEIVKLDEQPQHLEPYQLQKHEPNQLQQHGEKQQQQQELQQDVKEHHQKQMEKEDEPQKQIETIREKQQEQEQVTDYEEDEDEDDEEKDTSQKLVIDIPEEEEDVVEEKEEYEDDDDDVIALDDIPDDVSVAKEIEKVAPKPQVVQDIITLSDGEEDITPTEATSKPGKIQKRRSMGAGSVSSINEEDSYRLKRRKINVAGAPKMPLTGYLRYMHDRRELLRKEHPTKTAMEHTKMIGEEWHTLPSDVKASYLKAADADKERYVKELHSFLKTRPDILASEMAKNKKCKTTENSSLIPSANAATISTKSVLKDKTQTSEMAKTFKDVSTKNKMLKDTAVMPSTSQQSNDKTLKRKRTPTPPNSSYTNTTNTTNATPAATASSSTAIVNQTPGEIPIFTNEFLEHNKVYDMELRSLRKMKTDLEQQNSVLEKHVENMRFGVEKLITENNELEEKNKLLEIYLDKMKRKLALAFSSLPLPSAPNGATMDNIDKYMQDLYKMSTSNSHGPATLNKAKDIIRKLDLQIHL